MNTLYLIRQGQFTLYVRTYKQTHTYVFHTHIHMYSCSPLCTRSSLIVHTYVRTYVCTVYVYRCYNRSTHICIHVRMSNSYFVTCLVLILEGLVVPLDLLLVTWWRSVCLTLASEPYSVLGSRDHGLIW